jgi:hypothetical protein
MKFWSKYQEVGEAKRAEKSRKEIRYSTLLGRNELCRIHGLGRPLKLRFY